MYTYVTIYIYIYIDTYIYIYIYICVYVYSYTSLDKASLGTVNPQTADPQTENRRLQIHGNFPVGLGVPPLTI